MINSTFKCKQ